MSTRTSDTVDSVCRPFPCDRNILSNPGSFTLLSSWIVAATSTGYACWEMKWEWVKYENLSVDETDLRPSKPSHTYGSEYIKQSYSTIDSILSDQG